jgi:prepilin-type N-terminal cleavage/methylation domain-containing protein
MKRGFTLLELMIVIIIIGVLATVGIVQYQSAIERSRGAEAKSVIGQMRTLCAARYMQNNDAASCTNANLVGGTTGIPGPAAANCAASHWFFYQTGVAGQVVTFTATRCIAGNGGKTPDGTAAGTLTLSTTYSTGADSAWGGTGNY